MTRTMFIEMIHALAERLVYCPDWGWQRTDKKGNNSGNSNGNGKRNESENGKRNRDGNGHGNWYGIRNVNDNDSRKLPLSMKRSK